MEYVVSSNRDGVLTLLGYNLYPPKTCPSDNWMRQLSRKMKESLQSTEIQTDDLDILAIDTYKCVTVACSTTPQLA
ncbi:hypothetical protein LOAG_09842 [Loa loa]|uniref:Uncharacterized protein n=1 Tax=Loa loa TaxID=7209 RepID=A0A1S0TRM7_LOALO|nr:hypothetical protein LOAG_09842 [Loa loa]EFO18653.1 hypothetical protein LOAG_09842 [Loa loa]